MMPKLTLKQQQFINEYLIDLNATRAYKAAYTSCKRDETARANSSRMLTNANVQAYIKTHQTEQQQRTQITQDMVLSELASIAFANGADFATVVEKTRIDADTGEEKPYTAVAVQLTANIPLDKQKAIASIKQGKDGIEIKTADKVKALELLGRHFGMFTDRAKTTDIIPIVIADDMGGTDE